MVRRSKRTRHLHGSRTIPDPTLVLTERDHVLIDAAYAAVVEVFRKHGLTPPSRSDWRNARLRNGLIDYVLTVA